MKKASVIPLILFSTLAFLIFRATSDPEALKILYTFATAFLTGFVAWLFK